jgi:hypothetical protein
VAAAVTGRHHRRENRGASTHPLGVNHACGDLAHLALGEAAARR